MNDNATIEERIHRQLDRLDDSSLTEREIQQIELKVNLLKAQRA